MRVAAIEAVGHPVLGDLCVDLRGPDSEASRLVVLAGENGCGKTLLLDAIFAALQPPDMIPLFTGQDGGAAGAPKGVRVIVEADGGAALPSVQAPLPARPFSPDSQIDDTSREFAVWLPLAEAGGYGLPHYQRRVRSGRWVGRGQQPHDHAFTSSFYSEANVSFVVPAISTAHAANTNGLMPGSTAPRSALRRGGANLGSEIPQMLVNLAAADAEDLQEWVRQHRGEVPPPELVEKRWNAFSAAFDRIFEHKRLVRQERVGHEYRVVFEEHGRRSSLAELSTGEKQVVFRGAFLLRQLDELSGSVVLIDEPELSLHPRWQGRILDFYDRIVKEENGRRSQVILATHSPFIVHGSPTAKHVVLRRDPATGNVQVDPDPSYPRATTADIAVAAFNLGEFVRDAQGKRLAVVVEGPSDRTHLESAWKKRRPGHAQPFVVAVGGSAAGVRQLLGTEPGRDGPVLGALASTGVDRVVGLFDFDGEGYGQWNGTVQEKHAAACNYTPGTCPFRKRRGFGVWAALLSVPGHRPGYAGLPGYPDYKGGVEKRSVLTIDLLFEDQYVGPYLEKRPVPGAPGAEVPYLPDGKKTEFAETAWSFPPEAFAPFEPILALIERVRDAHDLHGAGWP